MPRRMSGRTAMRRARMRTPQTTRALIRPRQTAAKTLAPLWSSASADPGATVPIASRTSIAFRCPTPLSATRSPRVASLSQWTSAMRVKHRRTAMLRSLAASARSRSQSWLRVGSWAATAHVVGRARWAANGSLIDGACGFAWSVATASAIRHRVIQRVRTQLGPIGCRETSRRRILVGGVLRS